MNCLRCGGSFREVEGEDRGERVVSLLCVKCGNLLDRVILENRQKSKPLKLVREPRKLGRPRKVNLY